MQTGIHFHEAAGIEQTLDPLLGRLWEMMIAVRTNPLIFGHLNFVNDFAAAGTFLKEPFAECPRDFSSAVPPVGRGFLKIAMNLCARGGDGVNRERARFAQDSRAFAQRRTGGKNIVHEKYVQSSHVDPFS